MSKYIEQEFKTVLTKRKYIDTWYWDRYGLNPYIGCQIGCVYCDSRSEKYHFPADFDKNIIVKKNITELLDKRLTQARTLLPDVVSISVISDPYQSLEKKMQSTRGCLEVLAKHRYPVHILTKSVLIQRDLDLLKNIADNNWCCISITILSANPRIAKFLEKNAPSPDERFNLIKIIKQYYPGIQVGVLFLPIVPFLCDTDENLELMVKSAKESQADYLLFCGGMTIRDQAAKWFLNHLKDKYPELIEKYEGLYKFNFNPLIYNGSYEPKNNYTMSITQKVFNLCEKYQLSYRIKRFIPDDYRKINYQIAEMLLNKAYKYNIAGRSGTGFFWAGQQIQNLKIPITDLLLKNELNTLRYINKEIELLIKETLITQSAIPMYSN